MSSRETMITALTNAAPKDEPDSIVGGALELAVAELDGLGSRLNLRDDQTSMLLAAAIEGRLRALDLFISENLELTWKAGREPKTEGGTP